MKKHHYVYHSFEEWGRDYIGIRSCDCLPEEDTRYFGSFKDKTFKPTGKNILFVCRTRKEAAEIEIILHDFFDVAVNPQFANRSKAVSTGFSTAGVPRTEEQKKAMSGENHPLFGVPNSEAQKKAQSERMTGENNPMFGRSGEKSPRFGVPVTEEARKKMSVANYGEKHYQFGVPRTEEEKRKNSEANFGEKNPMYGRTGALSPNSKAIIVIEPDGTQRHFVSGTEAARDLKMNSGNLCTYLNTGYVPTKGDFKDWKFIFKNSEDS